MQGDSCDTGGRPALLTLEAGAERPPRPLDEIGVRAARPGVLVVRDGWGRVYHRQPVDGTGGFTVSGAPGAHLVSLEDGEGRVLDALPLRVAARTCVESADDPAWADLMTKLTWNVSKGREFRVVREDGEVRFLFSDWLRDHVHILKGKLYVHPALRDAIDLYARHQRADGMLYDFYMPHEPQSTGAETRFRERGWVKLHEDRTMCFERVPVENDVEYLFVLGLHTTWLATGDTAWMRGHLGAALKAMRYACGDPLRWSERHGLLKRGFTLDTWDFQSDADSAAVGDTMDIAPGVTRFCIFHGDNTGFAHSCRLLAEMMECGGDPGLAAQAAEWRERGTAVQERLDALAWNGAFYRHHVPEEPGVRFDFGVDPADQVSLSNAYALGRDVRPEQARAILATYRRIRGELPAEGVGEFVSLYPPCSRGWHVRPGEYVNGAAFPFIGGELAAGAFRHGESAYGADLLRRLHALLVAEHGEFPYYWYVGGLTRDPGRLLPVDIREPCNAGFIGEAVGGVPGWSGQGRDNDLGMIPAGTHTWHGIPCVVVDAAANGGRGCIGLATRPGYAREVTVPLAGRAGAIYVHHCLAGGDSPAGWVTLRYEDGEERRVYVLPGRDVANWWDPIDARNPGGRPHTGFTLRTAFVGRNARARVGTYLWGFDNPRPDVALRSIGFTHSGLGHAWFILGVTLGSGPRWLGAARARHGWLENWNAAAVIVALVEGLGGVRATAPGWASVELRPRWGAAGTRQVVLTAHVPASDAYVSYAYRQTRDSLSCRVAGCGERRRVALLLPAGRRVRRLLVDDRPAAWSEETSGDDRYAVADVHGLAAQTVTVELEP